MQLGMGQASCLAHWSCIIMRCKCCEGRLGVPENRGTCKIYPRNKGIMVKIKMEQRNFDFSRDQRERFSFEHCSTIFVTYFAEIQNET